MILNKLEVKNRECHEMIFCFNILLKRSKLLYKWDRENIKENKPRHDEIFNSFPFHTIFSKFVIKLSRAHSFNYTLLLNKTSHIGVI